ncbi:MAG TPA: hypothetical protein DIW81_02870 [Planctomycetaceae bacterium]|nr:hypothetical protein [Rubinisphaera sp.]HCS50526.1 hypothetical protein [Planctomycetaceae bacterium]|tara:strand:- start:1110 stop:1298 length:189 start_codon:yes stop_codon:yes gene_type:complete
MLPLVQAFSDNEDIPLDYLQIPSVDNNSKLLPGWRSRFAPTLNNDIPQLAQGIRLAQTTLML